jgi:hypothetical protein
MPQTPQKEGSAKCGIRLKIPAATLTMSAFPVTQSAFGNRQRSAEPS